MMYMEERETPVLVYAWKEGDGMNEEEYEEYYYLNREYGNTKEMGKMSKSDWGCLGRLALTVFIIWILSLLGKALLPLLGIGLVIFLIAAAVRSN